MALAAYPVRVSSADIFQWGNGVQREQLPQLGSGRVTLSPVQTVAYTHFADLLGKIMITVGRSVNGAGNIINRIMSDIGIPFALGQVLPVSFSIVIAVFIVAACSELIFWAIPATDGYQPVSLCCSIHGILFGTPVAEHKRVALMKCISVSVLLCKQRAGAHAYQS